MNQIELSGRAAYGAETAEDLYTLFKEAETAAVT